MYKLLFIALVFALFAACSGKKTETPPTADSVSAAAADVPAPAGLAFSPLNGYAVRNTVGMSDSVNFFLLTSQEQLDKMFIADRSMNSEMSTPDFVINYTVAVVCLPRLEKTTIILEKVEVGGSAINVYVTITRGEKQKFASKPAQIFAIERRDGYGALQFFVNGKQSKAIPL